MNTVELFGQKLHKAVAEVADSRSDAISGDYLRWSLVLKMLEGEAHDLLDVGIGRGQFPDAAMISKQFHLVRGVDRRKHTKYRNDTGFEYIDYDLTSRAPDLLRSDIVTCLECIEHIPSPQFEKAVGNLRVLPRERLIVTVPFEEKEPLPKMHYQRFTQQRLEELFPGGEITLLALRGTVRWALVDWRINAS